MLDLQKQLLCRLYMWRAAPGKSVRWLTFLVAPLGRSALPPATNCEKGRAWSRPDACQGLGLVSELYKGPFYFFILTHLRICVSGMGVALLSLWIRELISSEHFPEFDLYFS